MRKIYLSLWGGDEGEENCDSSITETSFLKFCCALIYFKK